MNLKNLSLAGLGIAVLSIVLLLFNESLFAIGPAGIAVQVFAAALMLWSRATFGRRSFHADANPTDGGLITTGPYRFFRHPIYAAILYFTWTGVIVHFAPLSVVLGIGITAGLTIRMLAEERLVAEKYPEYMEYAKKTKRVIPFIL